jgi:hypothetical protein
MKNISIKQLISTIKSGQRAFDDLSIKEKRTLEKSWDVEHAYYSSALEGSGIDRKQFERLAKNVS